MAVLASHTYPMPYNNCNCARVNWNRRINIPRLWQRVKLFTPFIYSMKPFSGQQSLLTNTFCASIGTALSSLCLLILILSLLKPFHNVTYQLQIEPQPFSLRTNPPITWFVLRPRVFHRSLRYPATVSFLGSSYY
jgi:hypothetical protein